MGLSAYQVLATDPSALRKTRDFLAQHRLGVSLDTFGATLRDVSVFLSCGWRWGVDARVGVEAMERFSERAFSGFPFSLWRKGPPRSARGKNKLCDQMTGTKALGLGLGLCPKPWIFQLLSGFFGCLLGSSCYREAKEQRLQWASRIVQSSSGMIAGKRQKGRVSSAGEEQALGAGTLRRGDKASCDSYHLREGRVLWAPPTPIACLLPPSV